MFVWILAIYVHGYLEQSPLSHGSVRWLSGVLSLGLTECRGIVPRSRVGQGGQGTA